MVDSPSQDENPAQSILSRLSRLFCTTKLDDEEIFACLKEAEEAYKRAEQVNYLDASALTYRSSLIIENINILRSNGHLKESLINLAEGYLKQAIQKKENLHLAYNRLGNLYRGKGNFLAARASYKKAIEYRSGFIVAYRNLGIIECECGNFRESLEYFEQGMKKLSDDALSEESYCFNQWHAWLHNGMGWSYLCRYTWNKSLNQNKNLEVTTQDRGIDLDLAVHQFHEAIGISKDQMYLSLSNLGLAYGLKYPKDPTKAIELFQNGLEQSSNINGEKWKELFGTFYGFIKSEEFKVDIKRLKRGLDSKIPMRMCNALLQDARMLQLC
jgi:tetratricopeptide (TPR) repeat protein